MAVFIPFSAVFDLLLSSGVLLDSTLSVSSAKCSSSLDDEHAAQSGFS
jgi:hypothetical protein